MKRSIFLCFLMLLFSGCAELNDGMADTLEFREKLLNADGCSFTGRITADYGDEIYSFGMDCTADKSGNITFSVIQPENISGISGEISASGGSLTFDDTVLGFPLLADGELSPASAPWIFLNSLRSGYLTSCAEDAAGMRLTVNDSYEKDALQLDIWFDELDIPYHVEILWHGRRVLTLEVENFEML